MYILLECALEIITEAFQHSAETVGLFHLIKWYNV